MKNFKSVRRFWRDKKGGATIEFVLWVPLFAALMILTANAAFAYLDLTKMENAARDGVRRLTMPTEYTTAEVVTDVAARLPDNNYIIDVSCSTSDVACIRISRQSDDLLSIINLWGIGNLFGLTMGAEVRMEIDPIFQGGIHDGT